MTESTTRLRSLGADDRGAAVNVAAAQPGEKLKEWYKLESRDNASVQKFKELSRVVNDNFFLPVETLRFSIALDGHIAAYDTEEKMYRVFSGEKPGTTLAVVPVSKKRYEILKEGRELHTMLAGFDPELPPMAPFTSVTNSVRFIREPNERRATVIINMLYKQIYLVFKDRIKRQLEKHARQSKGKSMLTNLSNKDIAMAAFLYSVYRPNVLNICVLRAFAIQEWYKINTKMDVIDIHIGATLFSVDKGLSPKLKREVAKALTGDPNGSADWDAEYGKLDGSVSLVHLS